MVLASVVFARVITEVNLGMANSTRIPIITITTKISVKEKPSSFKKNLEIIAGSLFFKIAK